MGLLSWTPLRGATWQIVSTPLKGEIVPRVNHAIAVERPVGGFLLSRTEKGDAYDVELWRLPLRLGRYEAMSIPSIRAPSTAPSIHTPRDPARGRGNLPAGLQGLTRYTTLAEDPGGRMYAGSRSTVCSGSGRASGSRDGASGSSRGFGIVGGISCSYPAAQCRPLSVMSRTGIEYEGTWPA